MKHRDEFKNAKCCLHWLFYLSAKFSKHHKIKFWTEQNKFIKLCNDNQ